jgi:hypothetical protein
MALPFPHGTAAGQIGNNANISLVDTPGSTGGRFIGFGEEGTSEIANRAHWALSANIDYLYTSTSRDFAVPTGDGYTSAGTSSRQITGTVFCGDSSYPGAAGFPNTSTYAEGMLSLFAVLDGQLNELISTDGVSEVRVYQVMDSTDVSDVYKTGFVTNPIVHFCTRNPSTGALVAEPYVIPGATEVRVVYGAHYTLETLPADTFTRYHINTADEVPAGVVLQDGTRAMTGNFNLNNQDLTNGDTINAKNFIASGAAGGIIGGSFTGGSGATGGSFTGGSGAAGVTATGGDTDSTGVVGTGGTTNGQGVRGVGVGNGVGVAGYGAGATAPGSPANKAGVFGAGGTGGPGGDFLATGSAKGIIANSDTGIAVEGISNAQAGHFKGGATILAAMHVEAEGTWASTGNGILVSGGKNGYGIEAIGGVNKAGVYGTPMGAGTTAGPGVVGLGVGTGSGVEGTGGATDNSVGIVGTSSATNGTGVQGTGSGTGYGVKGVASGAGKVGVGGTNFAYLAEQVITVVIPLGTAQHADGVVFYAESDAANPPGWRTYLSFTAGGDVAQFTWNPPAGMRIDNIYFLVDPGAGGAAMDLNAVKATYDVTSATNPTYDEIDTGVSSGTSAQWIALNGDASSKNWQYGTTPDTLLLTVISANAGDKLYAVVVRGSVLTACQYVGVNVA